MSGKRAGRSVPAVGALSLVSSRSKPSTAAQRHAPLQYSDAPAQSPCTCHCSLQATRPARKQAAQLQSTPELQPQRKRLRNASTTSMADREGRHDLPVAALRRQRLSNESLPTPSSSALHVGSTMQEVHMCAQASCGPMQTEKAGSDKAAAAAKPARQHDRRRRRRGITEAVD